MCSSAPATPRAARSPRRCCVTSVAANRGQLGGTERVWSPHFRRVLDEIGIDWSGARSSRDRVHRAAVRLRHHRLRFGRATTCPYSRHHNNAAWGLDDRPRRSTDEQKLEAFRRTGPSLRRAASFVELARRARAEGATRLLRVPCRRAGARLTAAAARRARCGPPGAATRNGAGRSAVPDQCLEVPARLTGTAPADLRPVQIRLGLVDLVSGIDRWTSCRGLELEGVDLGPSWRRCCRSGLQLLEIDRGRGCLLVDRRRLLAQASPRCSRSDSSRGVQGRDCPNELWSAIAWATMRPCAAPTVVVVARSTRGSAPCCCAGSRRRRGSPGRSTAAGRS